MVFNIFEGIILDGIHEFLNKGHGDIEKFKFRIEELVDLPMDTRGDGDNGGGDPSLLLDCVYQGSIFGMFPIYGFLWKTIVTICKFYNKNVALR